MIKYLFMAIIIVFIEVGFFVLLNSILGINYLVATPISMLLGIILNWYFSRVFVFNVSTYTPTKEFLLVFVASIVGMLIQTGVTYFVVEFMKLIPVFGKIIAIGVTFVWNFWIRRVYIFKESIGD